MQHCEKLTVANIRILVESEQPFHLSDRCLPFSDDFQTPDVTFRIFSENQLPDWSQAPIFSETETDRFLDSGRVKIRYTNAKKDTVSFCLSHISKDFYELYLCGQYENQLMSFNPLCYADLSEFLIQRHAAVLHSSFIRYEGQGILFTAPSGTGKSTQADLWHRYLGAEILNGDRSIIRLQNGCCTAYGSPYAGSSGIYRNESAPVRAVIVLRQAKENKIRPMALREAYLHLLSQMSISSSNREVVDAQSRWLLDFLAEIPVYLLECLPDQGAVELLHQTLGDTTHGK